MYPTPVIFLEHTGTGSALVRWEVPNAAHERVRAVVVYRSNRAVDAEDSEAFYAGEFNRTIDRMELQADTRALLDESPLKPAWYLVQLLTRDGDLEAVEALRIVDVADKASPQAMPDGTRTVTVGARGAGHGHGHSIYGTLPELIYRNDDPRGVLSMRTVARSLAKTHELETGDDR